MVQKILIFKFLLIGLFFILFSIEGRSQNLIIGKAKVIDGDTIHIGKNKIRLHGIDAPETEQNCTLKKEKWNCGIQSTQALINLISGREVICEIKDKTAENLAK